MELLNWDKVFFNYLSFAALLAFVFATLLAVFLLTLPNKSRSTFHMGFSMFLFIPFFASYVYAQMNYDPAGAYHRWLTVAFILPAEIHLTQWIFKFPVNTHPRVCRAFLIVQWLLAIVVSGLFVFLTIDADRVFLFSGHYWDFDADQVSARIAILIQLYLLLMLGVGFWKTWVIKTRHRWALLGVVLTFAFSAILPALTNALSRNGALDRDIHQTLFVISMVIAFFFMIIIYINSTEDRSSFMIKIVGISLVTFLLTLQLLGLITSQRGEQQYDALHLEKLTRVVESNKKFSDYKEVEYVAQYNAATNEIQSRYAMGKVDVPFGENREDFVNTRIMEKARALDDGSFRIKLKELLAEAPPSFAGFKGSIEDFLKNADAEDAVLKTAFLAFSAKLDDDVKIRRTQISRLPNKNFRARLEKYLRTKFGQSFFRGLGAGIGGWFGGPPLPSMGAFPTAINKFLAANPDLAGADLKREVLRFIKPFKSHRTRHYRANKDSNQKSYRHYIAYMQYVPATDSVMEIGYSYIDYRKSLHPGALNQIFILGVVLFTLLFLFPLFFRGALVSPLNDLLSGVEMVNAGDLTVKVPVKVQDEVGFLATSFNHMVHSIADAREQLQDYANNLEEKVKERTAELNKTLEQVQALKVQQDGDYFLTSLLAKPLNYNANKSRKAVTQFLVQQKKQFEFRKKSADLGGDLCVTGSLRIGKPDNYRRYVVGVNGDAMGKSMQGAGGSLVMGVVMNSIMARSAKGDRILDTTPEQWLTDVYEELHGVFLAFNGSMVISAVIAVVDEESGEMFYFNAEHPFTVLYRNGQASFIEEELNLRKIGLESEFPFEVRKFQLEPGDVVIMGSDGRDDIDLTPDEPFRTINEDEFLFLKRVEEADGDLHEMAERLRQIGNLTDDLSLMRLAFQENAQSDESSPDGERPHRVIIDIDVETEELDGIDPEIGRFDELFETGRRMMREGRDDEALSTFKQAYDLRTDVPALNKILGVLTFKDKNYEKAIEILESYLEHDPALADFWLYLSISHKRIGDFEKALAAANKVYELNPDRIPNLIQLADLHQKLGNHDRAREFIDIVLRREPNNEQARALQTSLA